MDPVIEKENGGKKEIFSASNGIVGLEKKPGWKNSIPFLGTRGILQICCPGKRELWSLKS